MLEYKTANGTADELVVIDRWYPSSKTCSACGHLLDGAEPVHPALDVPVVRHPA